jgi:hypothetical protein
MTEAKMSIVESSSEAHTLMEPVSHPVVDLSTMRKAAAVMESRAAEFFKRASALSLSAADVCAPEVAIPFLAPDFSKSMSERVSLFCRIHHNSLLSQLQRRACVTAKSDDGDTREDE